MNEEIEEFRKALMQQAYEDFLSWAWKKLEIHLEYHAYIAECKAQGAWEDEKQSFESWVTETYWGEIDD